jgi:hypothetical protein
VYVVYSSVDAWLTVSELFQLLQAAALIQGEIIVMNFVAS